MTSAVPKLKICTKCSGAFPSTLEFFYRHTASSSGLNARCKSCVNEDNRASEAKRKAKDPEKVRALNTARSKRHYHKDLDASRKKHRDYAASVREDPGRRAEINMRKRGGGAGLTVSQFQTLLAAQGGVCAICGTTSPKRKAGSTGWNLDHCHTSGIVRFILCGACNRGLGAFKDNPDLLRKAADILQSQKEQ